MATTTFTPSMLRGAGTRGIPEIAAGSSYSNTYSLSFDGTDDGIELGSTINLATTNTISIWVKRDDPQILGMPPWVRQGQPEVKGQPQVFDGPRGQNKP